MSVQRRSCSFAAVLGVLMASATLVGGQIYKIAEMNTRQIQALDLTKTAVLIPGGILEEHGPYLPSGTDCYSADAYVDSLARSIVERPGWSVVIFPQIPIGSDPANGLGQIWKFPGSYPVRMDTMRAVYMDLASALGDQGFRWVFLVFTHGAPTGHKALQQASDYFHDLYGGTMVDLLGLQPVADCCGVTDKFLSKPELSEEGFTIHAGADETSLLYFLRGDLLAPDFKTAPSWTAHNIPELLKIAKTPGWPGYFGAPRLTTTALGAQIFKAKAEKINSEALQILDGSDPRKIPLYVDKIYPVVAPVEEQTLKHEHELEKQEQQWLRSKEPQ
jgi:creatinine amidohydrolase